MNVSIKRLSWVKCVIVRWCKVDGCAVIAVGQQGEAHEKKKKGRRRKIDKWLEGQPDAAAFRQSMALLASMQPGTYTSPHHFYTTHLMSSLLAT